MRAREDFFSVNTGLCRHCRAHQRQGHRFSSRRHGETATTGTTRQEVCATHLPHWTTGWCDSSTDWADEARICTATVPRHQTSTQARRYVRRSWLGMVPVGLVAVPLPHRTCLGPGLNARGEHSPQHDAVCYDGNSTKVKRGIALRHLSSATQKALRAYLQADFTVTYKFSGCRANWGGLGHLDYPQELCWIILSMLWGLCSPRGYLALVPAAPLLVCQLPLQKGEH